MPRVVFHQAGAQGPLRGRLHRRIEGRANGKPPFVQRSLAVAVVEMPAHFLREIGRIDEGLRRPGAREEGCQHRGVGRGFADRAVLDHLGQNPIAARHRRLVTPRRVVLARRLGERGQIGHFAQSEFVERAVEIVERRRRHAVGTAAEIDLVEVELEDAVLAEGLLEAHREDGFLHLARERELVREQEVFRHLLCHGRGADRPAVLAQIDEVLDDRARHADRIDSEMFVEGLVLGGEKGLNEAVGHRRKRHEKPLLARVFGEQSPVPRVDAGGHRGFVGGKPSVVREVAAVVEEREGDPPRGQRGQEEQAQGDEAERSHRLAEGPSWESGRAPYPTICAREAPLPPPHVFLVRAPRGVL